MIISSDLLCCLCSHLDQATYVRLFLSTKRCAKLLISEPFLRVFFRRYRLEGLNLNDLQRGFVNVIKYPTETYTYEEPVHNVYYRAYNQLLIDVFDRVSTIEAGAIYHTNFQIKTDTLIHSYRYGNVFITSNEHLIWLDSDNEIPINIPDVSACLVCNRDILLYRQGDHWFIFNEVQSGFKLDFILPAACIRWMYVSIITPTSSEENRTIHDYKVHLILDDEGRLKSEGLVLARSVRTVSAINENTFTYITNEGELYISGRKEVTLVARDVRSCFLYSDPATSVLYYLSGTTLVKQEFGREEILDVGVTLLQESDADNLEVAWYSAATRSIMIDNNPYLSWIIKKRKSHIAQIKVRDFRVDSYHSYLLIILPPLI